MDMIQPVPIIVCAPMWRLAANSGKSNPARPKKNKPARSCADDAGDDLEPEETEDVPPPPRARAKAKAKAKASAKARAKATAKGKAKAKAAVK